MGFWGWFWIWLGLGIAALSVLGLILKSLYNRLESAGHQAQRLAAKLQVLSEAAEAKVVVAQPEDSLSTPMSVTKARLRAVQKAKIKKQRKRQRRLIASLKRYDSNESRFN